MSLTLLGVLVDTAPFAAQQRAQGAIRRRNSDREGCREPPADVPPPPANWQAPFAAMAESGELIWRTIDELHRAVQEFLGPVLEEGETGVVWSPAEWRWGGGM